MREGTPSGFSTMSTGMPSAMHGMSSTGTIFGDDALVAVAARHLVAGLQPALDRQIHLHHLLHARRQLVALRELLLLFLERLVEQRRLVCARLSLMLSSCAATLSFATRMSNQPWRSTSVRYALVILAPLRELLRPAVRGLADEQALQALESVVLDDAQLVARGPSCSASARRR